MSPFAALVWCGAALAGVFDDAAHAVLSDPSGWVSDRTEDRVALSHKPFPGTSLTAWQGTTVLDPGLTVDQFMAVLTNTRLHASMSDDMLESVPVRREHGARLYYQVLDLPAPLSDRYWLAYTRTVPNHQSAGTFLRQWSAAPASEATDVRADLKRRYPRAVEVTHAHGQWVVAPTDDGRVRITIRSVIDPGGNIPPRLAGTISGRGLAENIRRMENAARARAPATPPAPAP